MMSGTTKRHCETHAVHRTKRLADAEGDVGELALAIHLVEAWGDHTPSPKGPKVDNFDWFL